MGLHCRYLPLNANWKQASEVPQESKAFPKAYRKREPCDGLAGKFRKMDGAGAGIKKLFYNSDIIEK
jgi:hypothetical protein